MYSKIKKMEIRKLKPKLLIVAFAIFFNLLSLDKYSAQCEGYLVPTGGAYSPLPNPALPASCNTNFTGSSNKYKLQSTYVPALTDPVITVKVVVHVFMPTNPGPDVFDDISGGQFNDLAALQRRFALIQGQVDRYSAPRLSNYVAPPPYPAYINDSRFQFEVVGYYFYHNQGVYYYGTLNGLPVDNQATLAGGAPNPNYNPKLLKAADALSYIDLNYPDRLAEGLPILMLLDGQHGGIFSSTKAGAIPYVSVAQTPGNSVSSEDYNNKFAVRQYKHELGHCLGLLHTYYGNPCYPGAGSPSPETYNSSISRLDCSNSDYLSDIFLANNPSAAALSYPNAGTCSPYLNSCNSVYESEIVGSGIAVNTNNMMSDNSWNNVANNAVYDWISPLQMGRRIRSMHFMSNAFSHDGVSDWGNVRTFAKEARSEHQYPWNIWTDETWEFDVQMYKDIFVRTGHTLTIKCKVAMATDGKIVVERGAKLIIDGGEVTSWCKKVPSNSFYNMPLWFGVEVWGTPTQGQLINNQTGYSQYHGIVEIKNGGTLSYARNAIYTGLQYDQIGSLYTNSFTGGIILANNANFINNVRDLLLFDYQQGIVASKIVNCKFSTTGEIGKDGNGLIINPLEHVKLYKNSGLYFDGCTFENSSTVYTDLSSGIGIYSTDSHFNVGYNNAVGSTSNTKCSFKKLNVGIWIDNTNHLYTSNIKNSDFYRNNSKAVIAENCDYLGISENNIDTWLSQVGVYLYQCKYYQVKNNEFTSSGSRNGQTGLAIYSSGNGAHEVYRNNFSKMNYAIISMDNNGGVGSGQKGLKMNCNNFATTTNSSNMNRWDISLTKSGTTMPTIYPYQSSSGNLGINLVRNQYGAINLGTSTKNKFFVDASSNQLITHACNIDAITNPNLPNVRSSVQLYVNPTTTSFDYATDCKAYPSSSGGVGTTGQKLAALNSYIAELQSNNEGGQNDFEIQSTVSSKLNLFLTDTLSGSQDSVINILANNQGGMDDADIQLVFAFMKKGDFVSAINRANGLSSNKEVWKNLFSKIIPVEQDTAGVESITANPALINSLTTYANANGGDGQACAQAYLKLALGTTHDFPLVFPDSGSGSRTFKPSEEKSAGVSFISNPGLKLYPNPTNSNITVLYENESKGMLTLEIKDLLGKVIFTKFIKKNEKEHISLTELNSGVYLISIKESNNEIIYQNKVIKQD